MATEQLDSHKTSKSYRSIAIRIRIPLHQPPADGMDMCPGSSEQTVSLFGFFLSFLVLLVLFGKFKIKKMRELRLFFPILALFTFFLV